MNVPPLPRQRLPHHAALLVTATLLLLAGPVTHAADAPGVASQPGSPFKKITLQQAVRELETEANRQIRTLKVWPRKESNFADATNTTMPESDVLSALGRRWSPRTSLDGYVKWQLLSYQPSLVNASRRQLEMIVKFMPGYTPLPKPKMQQAQMFEYALHHPSTQRNDHLQKAIGEYQSDCGDVRILNHPAVLYNNRIIEELPQEDGIRMTVWFDDAVNRYKAGELSYRDELMQWSLELNRVKDDPKAMPPQTRTKLAAEAEAISKLDNPMFEKIDVDNTSGKLDVTTIGKFFPEGDYGYDKIAGMLGGGPAK